ncbi:MAG: ATP-binding protein [Deltaproteobacteria bacterium]|nr:ATP-binding protein [Deltaproteobacteria bacterium]
MLNRTLKKKLIEASKHYPVVTLTGPRQSGKTTLVRMTFPDYEYVSLEKPDHRTFAIEDPRGFLAQFSDKVILDEVQHTPDLFSYIQAIVDLKDISGQFILTGSQNFLLLQKVSQSLAGRCAVLHLLPFSLSEIRQRRPLPVDSIGRHLPKENRNFDENLATILLKGFYPRIHDKGLNPGDWLGNYYLTYIERDVRDILNVGDLETFSRFVRLCAGRNGQLLNLSSLANDCGVTHTTSKRWISILETSFIVFLLRPHFKNFSKRLIKSPKLYFLDTGLLSYLLRIRSAEDLRIHAQYGSIFESFVISELLKNYLNRGVEHPIYFWRDSTGNEIDILIDQGDELIPLEIKAGQTINPDFFKGIRFWKKLANASDQPAALVYGGNRSHIRSGIHVYPWSVF